uniref:Uncharacterized protein n=1 Tax=Rhipicephalus zambeziensis TaxID=60191 RepID=A0A224Y5P8_9ACAR
MRTQSAVTRLFCTHCKRKQAKQLSSKGFAARHNETSEIPEKRTAPSFKNCIIVAEYLFTTKKKSFHVVMATLSIERFYRKLVPEKSSRRYFVLTHLFDFMCNRFKTTPRNSSLTFAVVLCWQLLLFISFCFQTRPADVVLALSLSLKSLHIARFQETLALWLEIRGKNDYGVHCCDHIVS